MKDLKEVQDILEFLEERKKYYSKSMNSINDSYYVGGKMAIMEVIVYVDSVLKQNRR